MAYSLNRGHGTVAGLMAGGLIFSGLVTVPAWAQISPDDLVKRRDAGSSLTTTRDQLEPVKPAAELPKPRLKVEGDIEHAPCALDDPQYAGIKVTLSKAEFNNLGPVAADDLRTAYAEYLGTDVPISTVCQIRDAAATKLRNMGYVAAVQVPTQRIENGAVRFEVLYARLTAIRVLGKPGRNEKKIESVLNKLVDGQLFNRFNAERTVLLARDIPGYEVRLSLKPAGTKVGDMIGEVSLKSTPFTLDSSVQNLSGPSTGRWGGQISATFNGLTGMGDRTTLSFYSTSELRKQKILSFGHEFLLGNNGLRLGGHVTQAWTKPDLGPNNPKIDARTLLVNLEASYPLARHMAFSARASAGLDIINQFVRIGGAPLSRDRLRIGYLRLDADSLDLKGIGPHGTSGWRANASLELRKGFAILGASPDCVTQAALCPLNAVRPSVQDSSPTATVLRFNASIEARPVDKLTVVFSPRAQIGAKRLPGFEQFSAGNYTAGRGYDPGALTGESGFGFQSELRLDSFRLSPRSKVTVQPFVFADQAWLDNRKVPLSHQHLSSVGGGLRIGIAGLARLELSAAVPLSVLPGETTRRSPRLLMSLSTRLLPWRAN